MPIKEAGRGPLVYFEGREVVAVAVTVTVKLTSSEFDDVRKIVRFAQKNADRLWREKKSAGESQEVYGELYGLYNTCERLLNGALS